MRLSILPVYIAIVFAFCFFIAFRARRNRTITAAEAYSVYGLLFTFGFWTVSAVMMGLQDLHVTLMDRIPFLWQACVLMVVVSVALFEKNLRSALRGIANTTPGHWFIFIQALRIGALGSVIKVLRGEITSTFPLWVGIPDFLFGLSAVIVGWLYLRKAISNKLLIAWNLMGPAIILVPFVAMPYWMNEPGFSFIFEFPMILAPSTVVPILLLINFLMAWHVFDLNRSRAKS